MKRHVRWGAVLLGMAALAVASLGAAPAVSAEEPTPTLTMSWEWPIEDGQQDAIRLAGTGFAPGGYWSAICERVWMDDGSGGGWWEPGSCADGEMPMVLVGEDGVVDAIVPAYQAISHAYPQLSVTPSAVLSDADVVTVTGTGLPALSNTTDCNSAGCTVVLQSEDDQQVYLADGSLDGAFHGEWWPSPYTIGQTVTQQLEAIYLIGQVDWEGSRFPTNVEQRPLTYNPETGTFTTQYRVHRWLEMVDVVYAIEGHPQPVWQVTSPPPEGLVPYDYTFDCANLPAKQAGREIEPVSCEILVWPQDEGSFGNDRVFFTNKWLDVTADTAARIVKGTKAVQVSGTVGCTDPATVHLEGTLTQPSRKGLVTAVVRADIGCRGTTGWVVTTYPATGSFVKGTATLTLDASSPGFTPAPTQVTAVTLRVLR